MLTQYTLGPVRLLKRADPFLFGACVYIHDLTDWKGKRKSPKRGLQPSDRVKVSDFNGLIYAWTDAENLEYINNLTDMTPRTDHA